MDMIRLFIHDKCLERVFQLPKDIQKKVLEFQRKFRQNSKSEAIHLEPIHDFKDPQLRTARVDQKYRAIVGVPETGSDYFLLWVDNHDEAMNWAKNKIFKWNEHTKSAQLFTMPEEEIQATTSVIQQKALFEAYTDEQLLEIGVPSVLIHLVRSMHSLDDLEKAEQQLPVEAFEHLFYLVDGANIQTLINEVKEGAENEKESINNRRSFVVAEDKMLEEYLNGELSKWQLFLHPSQRKLVEGKFNGPVKVTGGGGTGKTVVALHRLKRLTAVSDLTKPVLFTTFTNALTTNLAGLIQKMDLVPGTYLLRNIDGLARELGKQYGLIDDTIKMLDMPGSKSAREVWDIILETRLTPFDAGFLEQEYQLVWLYNNIQSPDDYYRVSRIGRGKALTRKQKMEFVELVKAYQEYKLQHRLIDRAELFNKLTDRIKLEEKKPFSHVIADEVQDMSNVELRFLRTLVEEKENDLFLVGDPYQKIYARKINFAAAGINVRGNRSKRLRINYRTTEEIKRIAISTIRAFSYDDFDGASESMDGYLSLFHGERPAYRMFKSDAEEETYIIAAIKQLKAAGEELSSIAIACRLREDMRVLKSALHRARLDYFDITDNTGHENGVQLSTFHSLKGLEFKTVFLAKVNKQTAPLQIAGLSDMEEHDKELYIQSERSLMYVAMTRAISLLVITGTGVKSSMIMI
jgi:hypothetical protein